MRVGIIGTSWGRIHCGTFRAAGCEIAALAGQRLAEVESVAAEEGVQRATTDAAALRDCDIVVIASPTPTHLHYLRCFADKPVLCEKPVIGTAPEPGLFDGLGGTPKFVNYAFPFLDTARALDGLLDDDRLGPVRRILLAVGVRFPLARTPAGWFIDVAVHPLSWLLHRFGEFHLAGHRVGQGDADVSVVLEQPGRQIDVALYDLPSTGIRIDCQLVGERALARLSGGYRPERQWWFEPVLLEGEPVTEGEYSQTEDIWFRANRRAVGQFCAVVRGESGREDALARGSFDLEKAVGIERMLAPLLREEGVPTN